MTDDNVWVNSVKEYREILSMLIRHEIDMNNDSMLLDLKSALVKLQQPGNNFVSANEATEIISLLLFIVSGKYPNLYPVEFVKEYGGRYKK